MGIVVLGAVSPRARQQRIRAWLTQAVISQIYDIPMSELRSAIRGGARTALARRVAMYLVHVVWGVRLGDVAAAFARDRSAAVHACRIIEEMREDPVFDEQMSQIEFVLREAARAEAQP